MIAVLPLKTAEQQAPLRQAHDVPAHASCLFRAEENGAEIGWFALRQEPDKLTVLRMELAACPDDAHMTADDRYLAELMVRAAASYSINRMIPVLQYDEPKFRDFLRPFGFAEDETGAFSIEISRLIHRCGGPAGEDAHPVKKS